MKRVGDGWKIDAVQERLNGWQRADCEGGIMDDI